MSKEVNNQKVEKAEQEEMATESPVLTNKQVVRITPNMVKIFKKVDVAKYIRENQVQKETGEEATDLDKNLYGFELTMHILGEMEKYEKELFTIVSIVQGKTYKEVEEGDFTETFDTFEKILTNEKLMNFFTRLSK